VGRVGHRRTIRHDVDDGVGVPGGDAPGRVPHDEIRQRLVGIVEAALEQPSRRGCLVTGAIVERAHDDEQTRRIVQAALVTMEEGFVGALERVGHPEPRALARLLVVVVQGLRVVGEARPEAPVLHDAVDQVMALVH
jgi:TetR/AcrR family transcriptional repressor of nem operon